MTHEWQFDMQHSGITFTIRHMLVSKVRGRFTRWSGSLRWSESNPSASSVEVQIDASSVDTSEPQRDAHLRSPDFFDVEKFPVIRFKSTKVERTDDGFKVRGELTIRAATQPVVLNVEYGGAVRDPYDNDRAGFTARTKIDRKDFGMTFNQVLDRGGLALGDEVSIEIDVEAIRAAEAQRAAS
jgi:polyisoprenoid-binding protein YceI